MSCADDTLTPALIGWSLSNFTSESIAWISPCLISVLVLELWEGLERRCPRRCNTPWGPCTCQFEPPPALYFAPPSATTHIKPCLRLMSKSDADLASLRAELADDPERASELQVAGAHALWKARRALDKARAE